MPYVHATLEQRFWLKVRKTDDCWVWKAVCNSWGYGCFKVNGKMVLAHRHSWEMANGPIPTNKKILHKCDNTRCVRPEHLFIGTHLDNMRDASMKGRTNPWGKRYARPSTS